VAWVDATEELAVGGVDVQARRAGRALGFSEQGESIALGDDIDKVNLSPYRPPSRVSQLVKAAIRSASIIWPSSQRPTEPRMETLSCRAGERPTSKTRGGRRR
jgi:hypothetical protein